MVGVVQRVVFVKPVVVGGSVGRNIFHPTW